MTRNAIIAGMTVMSVVAFIIAGWLILSAPGRERARADAARASQIVAEGRAAAGADAVAIVTANASSGAEIDRQSQENRDAILNAPGAAVKVDPGLDAATRRALCMRASARRDPQCVALLNAGSR